MKSSKNMPTSGLWGELPVRETHKQEAITPDIIENVWRQVIEESNSSDCEYQTHRQPDYVQMPLGNTHVLNTINLHQQLRTMESGTVLRHLTVIDDKPQNNYTYSATTSNSKKKKVFKDNVNVSHITQGTAQALLKHAVITLAAHIGYEKASDSAISLLTDVAEYFLKRICLLLKVSSEQINYGFPDALEKVLLEANIGGAEGLHEYYEEYVLKFEAIMKKKVEKKMEEQCQMEQNFCNVKMELEDVANSLQFEDLSEFANVYQEVPTLQLLDPDMGFPPSLDAGFQMLHSLEQDELNSLEVEDDINDSSSPNTTGLQQTDIKKPKD